MSVKPRPSTPGKYMATVLAWVTEHGDLVGFDCPDSLPPVLFREMRDRRLIRSAGRGTGYKLTAEGRKIVRRYQLTT